jgi:hypothetical protein
MHIEQPHFSAESVLVTYILNYLSLLPPAAMLPVLCGFSVSHCIAIKMSYISIFRSPELNYKLHLALTGDGVGKEAGFVSNTKPLDA